MMKDSEIQIVDYCENISDKVQTKASAPETDRQTDR